MFLTSHDTGDMEQVCRRAIAINQGRIVWDGAVDELKRSVLATKILDLKLAGPLALELPEVTIRHADRYTAKLEVDTARTRIEAVVRAILERNTVLDITITDPCSQYLLQLIPLSDSPAVLIQLRFSLFLPISECVYLYFDILTVCSDSNGSCPHFVLHSQVLLLAFLVVAVFLVPLTDGGLPFGTLGFGMSLEFRDRFRSHWP